MATYHEAYVTAFKHYGSNNGSAEDFDEFHKFASEVYAGHMANLIAVRPVGETWDRAYDVYENILLDLEAVP